MPENTTKKKTMRIKELRLSEESGVFAISIVDAPAIEVDFMKFNKASKLQFSKDNEKMIITGPCMIPDQMIFRIDEKTKEEFYVYFSKSTIQKIAEQYLQESRQFHVTMQHETPITDVCLIESWIIEDPKIDKSHTMGYELPKGTWFGTMKINNKDVWENYIKTNEVKGFSIEGQFLQCSLVENDKTKDMTDEQIVNKIKDILSKI
jgi:hypothetical protein